MDIIFREVLQCLLRINVYCFVIMSVSWNIQPVFGEISDIVNILNDIRNELDNVKLINQRYGERIMILEKQVGECHMKFTERTKKESIEPNILKRITEIEHKIGMSYLELLERADNVANSDNVEHGEKANAASGENGHNANFDAKQVSSEPTKTKETKTSNDKRIVPVTGESINSRTRVAFTVYMSHNLIGQGEGDRIIPFDTIETNEGQRFNPVTHVFTCPVSGVYYFSHSAIALETILTKIVKDGTTLAYVMTEKGYDQGSNSVVTFCNEGNEVSVRTNLTVGGRLLGDRRTTFTGYLLWEI